MDDFERLLDRIDGHRYDVDAIVNRLNGFGELPEDERDAEEFGIWGFAGLDGGPTLPSPDRQLSLRATGRRRRGAPRPRRSARA
jgi:hypothetical protein